MREVKFKKLLGTKVEDDFNQKGIFHEWGVSYEEFESGPGNFTTGIIEMHDGSVESVPVELFIFEG